MKSNLYGIIFTVVLIAFTLYAVLDTFVIPRAYVVVDEDSAADEAEETQPSEFQVTETSYKDKNISITITQYREYDTEIYVADVVLSSPEYFRSAFAENSYGRNIKEETSDIAIANDAIFAVNGDFYGAQTEGYVLRDGVIYRDEADEDKEDLAFLEDGTFMIFNERDITAQALLEQGVRHVLSFGPALLQDHEIMVTQREEVGKAKESNPRTAVGIYSALHYAFVVSDGRTEESEGLSLHQLAEVMQDLGVVTAYNLDGGGSATMYFNGEIINKPTANGEDIEERKVSDIVYIGYDS